MATFTSDLVRNRAEAYTPPVGGQVFTRTASYEPTKSLPAADVVEMIPVFKGERVLDLTVVTDIAILDGGNIDVGDGDDPDRYVDNSEQGAEGGRAEMGQGVANTKGSTGAANGVALYKHRYTEDDTIDITIAQVDTAKTAESSAPLYGRVWMQATLVSSF